MIPGQRGNGRKLHLLAQSKPMPKTINDFSLRLPNYQLYGEDGQESWLDWVHCELIADRSCLHDWEIKPHRHEMLCQLLLITQGEAEVMLDDQHLRLRGPALVLVPPLVAHGFSFSESTIGHVVTIEEVQLRQQLLPFQGLPGALSKARAIELDAMASSDLEAATRLLRKEFLSTDRWRMAALASAVLGLALAAARLLQSSAATQPGQPSRSIGHLQRYKALIEASFRQHPPLAVLAKDIGITPTQLNRICRGLLGHSAQHVLHQRLLLEAKRELTFTTLAVKRIAAELGFADAAYFTRFFQQRTAMTPSAWRAQGLEGKITLP